MFGWLKRRESRPLEAIAPELWERLSASWLFLRGMPAADGERLRALSSEFVARKQFSGTHGLEVTPAMQVEIAAQASILVLELGLDWYEGWTEVIVYPSQFVPEREVEDEAGVVHQTRDPMAGEAWLGGPVILSYEDVAMAGNENLQVAGYNVVIHEFAHKLDMRRGDANGHPPLHADMSSRDWKRVFSVAYEDFAARVDAADARAEWDGGAALAGLAMDPYASESPGEFFAVASEAFFEMPERLEPQYPQVYAQLRAFYRQDPLARLGGPAACAAG